MASSVIMKDATTTTTITNILINRFVDSLVNNMGEPLPPKLKRIQIKKPKKFKFLMILNSTIFLSGKTILVRNLLNDIEKNQLLHMLFFSGKNLFIQIEIPNMQSVMSNLALLLNYIFGEFAHYNVYSPQCLKLQHTGVRNEIMFKEFHFIEKLIFTKLGTLYIYLGRYSPINVLREISFHL